MATPAAKPIEDPVLSVALAVANRFAETSFSPMELKVAKEHATPTPSSKWAGKTETK